ncbi:MAG: sugar transferase [Desulfobulbaceae bacterium]|nr:sugar transferase [Desulfobulbaceae bacterium]
MLRKQSGLLYAIHQVIDLAIVTISFYCAYLTKISLPGGLGGLANAYSYNFLLLMALCCFHISLQLFGAYAQYRNLSLRRVISRTFKATMTGMAGIIFLCYIMHFEAISRLLVAIFATYTFIGLAVFKITLYKVLARTRLKNYNTRSVLIIGSRQRAIDFIKVISRQRETGYRIRGCLETCDQEELVGDRVYESVKIIGTLDRFKTLLEQETIDEIVFALPLKEVKNIHEYIYYAEEMGKNIRVLPDFQMHKIQYFPQTAKVNIEDFLGVTTLALSSVPKNGNQLLLKSFVDYVCTLVGVILLSPVFLLIGLAIKATSKGPILFSQERSGLNGRRFKVHKFRTMVVNAEELKKTLITENEVDGPVFKIKKDPRITGIGSILRKTSLDELPQLFNVLKGEMSLVGPRPPIPAEVEEYKLWQRRRLSMKPGLTCIWQVSGRNKLSFEQWMNMDLEYIDNWSLGLDFKLLVLTVKEVTVGGGS